MSESLIAETLALDIAGANPEALALSEIKAQICASVAVRVTLLAPVHK